LATEFGAPRRHYRLTDSTNERACELAAAGAPSGTVVTASEQSAGRGRHGRSWVAPPGEALLCSAILRPLGPGDALLPLAVPLAVCEACEELADGECRVKWPNDVWIDGRKVAGVLIEARPQDDWAVVGVGLNVSVDPATFPAEFRDSAASLGLESRDVERALEEVCDRLDVWVGADPEAVLRAYRERDALNGMRIGWRGAGGKAGDGSGRADGVAEDGNLLVVTDDGERLSLAAGEVSLSL
jgi:BirA family biotin operon repressor/biotin-[acetyl-CoA-carboxylase] ligase